MTVGDVSLTTQDHCILLHPTVWMSDIILSTGQDHLSKQSTWPYLGQMWTFDIKKVDFIQIISNEHDYWLIISTIGAVFGTVNVYDSLYESVSMHAKKQLVANIHTDNKIITLDVQQQSGSCACGLFA